MMDFEWKPSVETVLRCISTFSGLKITKAQWDHKHSSVPKWNFDKVKNQQTIILLIPSKFGKLGKTSWICVASPLIQRRPPPPLALPPQPQCSPLYLLNQKENIRNSSWLPKLVVHRSGFSPVWETKCSLRSEWQRAENWLLPTLFLLSKIQIRISNFSFYSRIYFFDSRQCLNLSPPLLAKKQ